MSTYIHTHTHTRLTALCPGLPRWAGTRKVQLIWILLKQETVSGIGISWAICKSAPCSRQITMPAPHRSVFYRPDALPAAQPTVSEHWRHIYIYTHRQSENNASSMKKIKITYWGKRLIKVQLEQNNWTEVWLRFYLHPGGVWWIKSRIHSHRVIEMWWVVASDQHNWTSAQQQQLIRLNTHTQCGNYWVSQLPLDFCPP